MNLTSQHEPPLLGKKLCLYSVPCYASIAAASTHKPYMCTLQNQPYCLPSYPIDYTNVQQIVSV